jgi:hypothetical protein
MQFVVPHFVGKQTKSSTTCDLLRAVHSLRPEMMQGFEGLHRIDKPSARGEWFTVYTQRWCNGFSSFAPHHLIPDAKAGCLLNSTAIILRPGRSGLPQKGLTAT